MSGGPSRAAVVAMLATVACLWAGACSAATRATLSEDGPAGRGQADVGPVPVGDDRGGDPAAPAAPAATLGPHELFTLTGWDAVQAIDRPAFWSAREADAHYGAEERVVGVAVGGEARAYSLSVLGHHEIVNDTVAGTPIVVAWSPLCFAAAVYRRPTVDGRELDFGVSGKLLRNGLVLYDRQSSSLWSQMLGQAVWGALAGWSLDAVPSVVTTWSTWRTLHPATVALVKTTADPDPYSGYYHGPQVGARGALFPDDRLAAKALVTGAVVGGSPVAYPHDVLAALGAVNDEVAGVPLVMAHDAVTGASLLFEWPGHGHAPSLSLDTVAGGGLVLRDERSGVRWSGWTGEVLSGAPAQARLPRLPATTTFWFAWKDHHPDTRLYAGRP